MKEKTGEISNVNPPVFFNAISMKFILLFPRLHFKTEPVIFVRHMLLSFFSCENLFS